jgi:TolA-binding protein
VEEFRQKWNAAKAPSEAQRFFQQGELLAKQGNGAAARKTWHSLIDVFAEADGERLWVERARRALADMDKEDANQDRFRNVRAALEKAETLQHEGKHAEAERIWAGIEQLYRNDPAAEGILAQVQKARNK